MWYEKYPTTVAGRDYVKEKVTWANNSKAIYREIEH